MGPHLSVWSSFMKKFRGAPSGGANEILRSILSTERWFADGEPRWERAPSAADADLRRRGRVKRLRRFGALRPALIEIADLLASCAPGQRCGSGACPACTRALPRWMIQAVQRVSASR